MRRPATPEHAPFSADGRSFVVRTMERLLKVIKGDREYAISTELSLLQALSISIVRVAQLVRGTFLRPFLDDAIGLLFVGRRVTVRNRRQIVLGRSVTLDDGCLLDALSKEGIRLGNNVSIARNTELRGSGVFSDLGVGISVGNDVGIAPNCHIAGQGGVSIGNDVLIGPGVMIFSENHVYEDEARLIRQQGTRRLPVTIESNCWIGARSVILGGVTIGAGSVVAAGSVVTRNVPMRSVVAGVPARVIKQITPADSSPSVDSSAKSQIVGERVR